MSDSSSTGKLNGKVAIVTGGASGIGEATARCFARHGARAVVIADVQDEKGRAVAASIGGGAYFRCDVTDENQVKALVEFAVAEYGRLDVMFSNAGSGGRADAGDQTVLDLDLAGMDGLFAVNVRGTAACVKHAARVMVEKGVKGSVVSPGLIRTPLVLARIGGDAEEMRKVIAEMGSLKMEGGRVTHKLIN